MTHNSEESPPLLTGLEYVRPLGAGGFANVYLYEQERPKRQVAVKVLKSGLTEAVRRQFTDEANAMAALEHPNIVPVIMADVAADGRPYMVMTFYSRASLGVRAVTERFPVSEVLRIGVQIASAVETAHRAGILHCDIKPANVLTDQYGKMGLTDFGIATQVAAADAQEDVAVSLPWAAPEVIYAVAPASVQSDVYSLAATLWHLLVGHSPFEVVGTENSQLELMQRAKSMTLPSTARTDAPSSLERLLGQAMAKDPAARPTSAIDFARSLQSIEQELHLQRTEIVVMTEDVRAARGSQVVTIDDDRTRMRAPTRIDAQPVPTPPLVESAAPAPAPQAEATVHRPPVVLPEVSAGPARPDVGAASDRSRWFGAAALLVVLIVVVVGFIALAGGSDEPSDTQSRDVAQTPLPEDFGPPGDPTVSAKRIDANTVEFSWTYSNAADTDTYRWQLEGGSQQGLVEEPTVSINSPVGTRVCAQVKVVRADGSNAALKWSDVGCVS